LLDTINAICVYCSASNSVKDLYKDAAKQVGAVIAQNGKTLVYGGGDSGLMGISADSALEHGGKVIGVITHYLENLEVRHDGITESHSVPTMHTRKTMMVDKSDAFIIMPGSLGTLDELAEICLWKQLSMHTKPIIILNMDGFWDGFLMQIDRMTQERCMPEDHKNAVISVNSVEEIIPALKNYNPGHFDVTSKWKT
jgi:uncharacterized protein (TIGR00730 family)